MSRFIRILIQAIFWGCIIWGAYRFWDGWIAAEQLRLIRSNSSILLGLMVLGACIIMAMVLRGVRWGRLQSDFHYFPIGSAIITYGWSFIPTIFTPFRIGEAFRALWVAQQGGTLAEAGGVILAERALDLVVLSLLLFLALITWPDASQVITGQALGGFVIIIALAYFIFFTGSLRRIFNRLIEVPAISGTFEGRKSFKGAIQKVKLFLWAASCMHEKKNFLPAFSATVAIWLLLWFGFWCFLRTFFPQAPAAMAASVLVFVNLSGLLAITPGNLGLYEMAAVLAMQGYGVDISQSLIPAMSLHLMSLSVTTIYGILCKAVSYFTGYGS